jgi:hypothetical protein
MGLEFEITGLANGAPVEVVGNGEIDACRLRLEVRTARSNILFDPALVAVGILDVLAFALGNTHVRSRTDLYDEHGREAGGWRVLAALTRDNGTLRLPPYNRWRNHSSPSPRLVDGPRVSSAGTTQCTCTAQSASSRRSTGTLAAITPSSRSAVECTSRRALDILNDGVVRPGTGPTSTP